MAETLPPSISVSLSIDPPSFSPGAAVNLTVTAVSHAWTPITIFTWPSIFNLDLAQKWANFTCVDLNTAIPLHLELTKGPKRPGFSRELGGRDDAYFCTLEPEESVTFQASFKLASRTTEGPHAIVPGHRYRFGVREGENVEWWRAGKREDVMSRPGEESGLGDASGMPIVLYPVEAIEFEIKEQEE
ncbi:hypothetical protein EV356DRAFT_572743 [Viridothelium virens]|uniref:Arrestin-like N-terminal domain-containing protein n=1 Tax=Viridothelium virens TaxID=1048519 RepID=A0A6A6HP33_VIRVR|nr:hypothetical protein EV356DRAFT_572743 [Viridothelium virens]